MFHTCVSSENAQYFVGALLLEYNIKNSFGKIMQNVVKKLLPDPFLKNQN